MIQKIVLGQRKEIEDNKPEECNEVIMCNNQGYIYEGLSSNVIAVHNDGTLVTANEGILHGTIRNEILDICKEKNHPVKLEPPNLLDLNQWKEIWVTSTSRLILPVSHMLVPETDWNNLESKTNIHLKNRIEFGEHPVAEEINSALVNRLRKRSTRIINI
eukprot:gb/GECH01014304.1/.p1 GENE.gb/GECH01014304.1/~~gb/GECH01014304.1/.p1  ORF type:complete len:160 (+),score=39.86 gb/GECH01014304.1/:1-480(+)